MEILCFDIGGTNLRAAVINNRYEMLKTIKIPTKCGEKKDLYAQIVNAISELSINHPHIETVVFGVPGRVQKNDFSIKELPNVGVKNIDLVSLIKEHFPHLKTYVYNDADLAGLYEAYEGNGKKFKRVFYLTISTGLGGAMFDNKVWTPSSTEIGHSLYTYQGKMYEIEHLCSGSGLLNIAKLYNLDVHSSKDVFQGFKLCVPQYVNVMEEWLNLFKTFILDVQKSFNPDVFVLGGGMAFEYQTFINSLKHRTPKVKYRVSSKIDDAGLLGCVSLVLSISKGVDPFKE